MRTYISSIIPKLSQFSEKLDNSSLLISRHWVVIDDANSSKLTYIFRSNGDLLLSQLGKVQKAKWEYLGSQTLLIDKKEDSFLFKHGFFNEDVLALKIDNGDEYAILVSEEKYEQGLKSIDSVHQFLESMYDRKPEYSTGYYIGRGGNNPSIQIKSKPKLSESDSFTYFFLFPLMGFIFIAAMILYLAS